MDIFDHPNLAILFWGGLFISKSMPNSGKSIASADYPSYIVFFFFWQHKHISFSHLKDVDYFPSTSGQLTMLAVAW